jgi:heat shock protein HslJ
MNARYFIFTAATLAILPLMAGCGLFTKTNVQREAVMPNDRETVAKSSALKTYSPEELNKGVIKGDWTIDSVYSKPTVGEETPFLKFVPSENRIYGNNGCNVINAKYEYNPSDSTISFSELACTMMLCNKDGLTDYEINTALGSAKFYSWSVNDSEYYLTFYDEIHHPIMKLLHQNFDFLNGTWGVSYLNGEKINVEGMKFVIDIDEGRLHGNSGCNIINGSVEIDMETPNSISFSGIMMTKMACPDLNYETALVVALEEVTGARPISASEVSLFDSQQQEIIRLCRAADK